MIANVENPRFLKEHGVAVREGPRTENGEMVIASTGYVACETCGSYLGPTYAVARTIGVSEGMLRKWLTGQPVRPDVATRIRSSFKAVHDGA